MSKNTLPNAPAASRLIELLSQMTETDRPISHKNFSLRLSQLIDLSDSFSLSDSFRGIPRLKAPAPQATDVEIDIKENFIQSRSDMVSFIIKSFVSTETSKAFRLPEPTQEQFEDSKTAFDSYQRFYAVHQSDLDVKVMKCRNLVRKSIENHSLAMKQLAALDVAIANTLSANTRQAFTAVPKLLKIRFQQLLALNADAPIEIDLTNSLVLPWLTDFLFEMRQVLLAELDVRLQPVLGLIEAFDEEIK